MNKYGSNTINMFFCLLRAGLWNKEDQSWIFQEKEGKEEKKSQRVDWQEIYKLAVEQTVAGYVAAGVDKFIYLCAQKKEAPYSVETNRGDLSGSILHSQDATRNLVPEKVINVFNNMKFSTGLRNFKINSFLAGLIKYMNDSGIEPLLLKGQGVAQNYIYPEIRQAGDIDLLLNGEDYKKAVDLLEPKAGRLEKERHSILHYGMHFGDMEVELHGTVNSNFGKRFNSHLDDMQAKMFERKDFRYWLCEGINIPIPSANFDSVFIFTHFLDHFYFGGLGLRQICDWAMFLHNNRDFIDKESLQKDIISLGLMKEWKSFGCFVVKYLGLPENEMPFYDGSFLKNSDKIRDFLFESGNFGRSFQRKDYSHKPYIIRKSMSLFVKGWDIINKFSIFPRNTIRFLLSFLRMGFSAAVRGE